MKILRMTVAALKLVSFFVAASLFLGAGILLAQTTDLALGKPVVSVSSTATGSNPANAVDGNPATFWTSAGGGAQWLSVDLGASVYIGRVVVSWGSDSATSFDIEFSEDGLNYAPVWSGAGGNFDNIINRQGRYVMVRTSSGVNPNQYQLASLEVYAGVVPTPTPTPTPTTPTPTPTPTPTSTTTPTPTPIPSGPTPAPTLPPSSNTITLNPATRYQTIEGWEAEAQAGAVDCPGYSTYKNSLFDQAVNELGLNRLRVGISPSCDTCTTFDLSPSSYFVSVEMASALAMKPRLEAKGERLWVNVNFGGDSGFTSQPDMSKYAQEVLRTYQFMQTNYGFVPDSWEVALEPGVVTGGWYPYHSVDAIIRSNNLLKANGFNNTYFIAPSSPAGPGMAITEFNNMLSSNNDQLPTGMKEFAYHRYGAPQPGELQTIAGYRTRYGINTAQLEHGGSNYGELHEDLKQANVSAWQQMGIAYCNDLNSQYVDYDYFNVQGSNFTMRWAAKWYRHIFKYVRAGAVRIQASSTGDTNIDPLAFINSNGTYVVVVWNKTWGGKSFSISNLPAGTYGIKYITGDTYNNNIQLDTTKADVTLTSGQILTENLPEQGVMTIYGKTPTASPTPTPTPAPCTLTSASWSTTTAVEGTTVNLNVTGNSACNGQQVSFTVMENDSIAEGIGDDPVTTNPVNVTFSGTTATGTWIAEWQNDCAGLCNPPEYYFNATVGTQTLRSADPLLTVTQAVIPTPTPTPQPGTTVGRYDVFETTLTYSTSGLTNPWEQVSVAAAFTSPSGKVLNIDGFYYDVDTYKVRFTPAEVGAYTYSGTITGPSGNQNFSGSFTSVASANKGFLRRQPGSPYKLQYDDGSFFIGTGFEDCWGLPLSGSNERLSGQIGEASSEPAGEGGEVDVDVYFQKYGNEAKFNLHRWNPDNCSFDIYNTISTTGNTYLVREGKLGDQLLSTAKAHGFHNMFAFFYTVPYLNAVDNTPEADAIKRALRYAIARYGAYTDFWDITNETLSPNPPDSWLIMAASYIRSIDPYVRPITNSIPRSTDPNFLDLHSPHLYNTWQIDFYTLTNKTTGLPVVVGEAGNGQPAPGWDPQSAFRMRIRDWTGTFGGVGVVYWNTSFNRTCCNQYMGSEERGYNKVLHDFFADAGNNMTPAQLGPVGARGYSLTSSQAVRAYVFRDPGTTASATTSFSLNIPFAGTASWVDPKTGNTLGTSNVNSGNQTLTSPAFVEDIALKINSSTLPSPTPTPTPVPCTLTSASWPVATAVEGISVGLDVGGTNCAGKTVSFEVRRFGSTPLDDIPANIQPAPIVLNAFGVGSGTWTAEFSPLIPGTNPDYYFKATVSGGNTIDNKTALLTVTQAITPTPTPTPSQAQFVVETVVSNLTVPWALDFLPDNSIIFTERPGGIRLFRGGQLYTLATLSVASGAESGLMGLAVDPNFSSNNYFYVMYAYYNSTGGIQNRVSRFTLSGTTASGETTIFDPIPGAQFHDGGRLKFGPDGKLYITAGDTTNTALSQDLASIAGKILRINPDGSIPADNPFPGSAVYSLGHRNPQGLAFHPVSQSLYSSEHGPSPGANDEINFIKKGANYGWPATICSDPPDPRFEEAIVCSGSETWAPAGTTFYSGDLLPWKNNLFVTNLRGNHLRRIVFGSDNITPIQQEVLLNTYGRLRDVVEKNGYLYVTTSNRDGRGSPAADDDKILRIRPITLPSPTPTATPTPCTLTGATWDAPGGASSVVSGTPVTLTVNGSNCDGQTVNLLVRENDSILEGGIDEDASSQPSPNTATFVSNTATISWTATYMQDGLLGAFDPPEYYFNATVGTSTLRSADPLLTVTQVITPTPTPTPTTIPTPTPTSGPYGGTPAPVPGTIQVENFDNGGEGIAYHDLDPANQGGAYRGAEGVDIETTGDTGGGYNVGWIQAGEWLNYTVNITQTGNYTLSARIASSGSGGNFHVEIDGVNVTQAMTIPNTGDWQTYQNLTKAITLTSTGNHILKFVAETNGSTGFTGNLNYLTLQLSTGSTPTPTPTSTPAPATITLNPATTYQTMLGNWEATDYIGAQNDPVVLRYRDALLTQIISDVGINRIRLEIRSGVENSQDYWTQYITGQIDYPTWRSVRYQVVNDNSDPNNINQNGFQFSEKDWKINNIVIPLKQRLEAQGEKLFINLNYVGFGGTTIHMTNPQEYAEFMLAVFQHMQTKYGFVPDAIEIELEPDNTTFNGTLMGQALQATAAKLAANGFSPKYVVPSTTAMDRALPYFNEIRNVIGDAGVRQYVQEISYHRYDVGTGGDVQLQQIANTAASFGIGASMLEWWFHPNPAEYYKLLHKDLKLGRNSAWQQGTFLGVLDVNTTDPNNPQVVMPDATKFTRQYYKFIRDGAVRIDAQTQNANFDPVAFKKADGKTDSNYTVVVNAAAGGNFSIGNLPAGTYGIKYTTSTQYNIDLTDQTITSGQNLSTNIPAAGAITIYGKTPTVSPTPTPTPVPCTLTSASWSTTTAVEGNNVNLNVTGNSACNGQQVSFTVMENDSILEGLGDDPVTTNPVSVTFSGTTATGIWIAEWQNDCAGLCNPPEYYFNATVGTSTIRSSDPLLTVTQAVTPTPTPTPIPSGPTPTPGGQIPVGDWPQLQHDASHSGITSQGVVGPFKEKWRFNQVPISGRVQPIVVGGKVYIGSNNGKMYALDANNGAILWEYQTGGMIVDSAAYSYTTGYVYFGSTDNYVYALEANTGALKWKKLTGGTVRTVPVIAYNRIYIGSSDGVMHAYNEATGNEDWTFTTDNNAPILEPAAVANNTVFFGDDGAKAYAQDANTGQLRWKTPLIGQSIRDRWPVVINSSSGTKVVFVTQPYLNLDQIIGGGTQLMVSLASTSSWPAHKQAIQNFHQTNPDYLMTHVLDASTGAEDFSVPILYVAGTQSAPSPPVGTNDSDTKVIYRYSEGVNPPLGTSSNSTTNYWSLYVGQWNLSTHDIIPLETWGSTNPTGSGSPPSWSTKSALISDESAYLSQGGNNLYYNTWRGLYLENLSNQTFSGILQTAPHAIWYLPYSSSSSKFIFSDPTCVYPGYDFCGAPDYGPKAEARQNALRSVTIGNGLIFWVYNSTLVAIEGTVQ